MASDSEGFESAEEESEVSGRPKKNKATPKKETNAWNDSDSDDDTLNKISERSREQEKMAVAKLDASKENKISTTNELSESGDANKQVTTTVETVASRGAALKSKRPEREPRQPKPRGGKLGAVKLGSKLSERTTLKTEEGSNASDSAQCSESRQEDGDSIKQLSQRATGSVSTSEKSPHPVLEKLSSLSIATEDRQENSQSAGWGGWGSWGVNSLLSTASNLTTHVSQGISTVTSVLETGLGAPDPEELARLAAEEEKAVHEKKAADAKESAPSSESGNSGSSMSFGNVLRLVESTAGEIVSGGLSTLEILGKKTMDVLQDGDPGLKKKRAYFFPDADRPVLSQLLREAKDKAEAEASSSESAEASGAGVSGTEKKLHFETLFDDYQGLVHLEALEMLSRQCQLRLQSRLLSLSGVHLTELQRNLSMVKELCEFPDEEEETSEECTPDVVRESLEAVTEGLGIPLPYEKIVSIYTEEEQWLSEVKKGVTDVREIHTRAITTLAKLAAATAELFHKMAELLLVKEVRDTTDEAKYLVAMTTLLCSCASALATKFSDAFTAVDTATSDISGSHRSITNIFLEASHSSSYIQDAGNLLVPVLQIGMCCK